MTYAGLTTADKGALLDAKARGLVTDYVWINGLRFLVNIDVALAQIAEMESEPETIYGYPIEYLQKVAVLLRDERMTISDLKKCVDNFTYCAEMTLKMIRADTEASLAQSIADMQNFYSPYTEGEKK